MDAERLGRLGPPLGPLGGGHLGPRGLAGLLRSAGGRVEAERLDMVYADAQAWWASSGLMVSGDRWSGWAGEP